LDSTKLNSLYKIKSIKNIKRVESNIPNHGYVTPEWSTAAYQFRDQDNKLWKLIMTQDRKFSKLFDELSDLKIQLDYAKTGHVWSGEERPLKEQNKLVVGLIRDYIDKAKKLKR
jgi:hypothetical protein